MSTWHIVTSEYPPDIGGVADYTRCVAEGLASCGDDVHVWCPHGAEYPHHSTVQVHPELGRIRPADLRRVGHLLNGFAAPRRLLVQWVPHGFGFHSMNVWFCMWLAKRVWQGDHLELMVHEPYLEFRGPMRHKIRAVVHRLMTILLLGAARRVWMSIPAWERLLRPYSMGREITMQGLPVPASLPPTPLDEHALRRKYARDDQSLVGHFGTFGPAISSLLAERLPAVMDGDEAPALLLIGAGSHAFTKALLEHHPGWSSRVNATGYLAPTELAAHIAACDVFLQPYPDGISSRRTSAVTCLTQGRAVVTTSGHLTEALWSQTGAAILVDVSDPA